jgi:hypothetical protein
MLLSSFNTFTYTGKSASSSDTPPHPTIYAGLNTKTVLSESLTGYQFRGETLRSDSMPWQYYFKNIKMTKVNIKGMCHAAA